jgi:hypothetical protein
MIMVMDGEIHLFDLEDHSWVVVIWRPLATYIALL